MPKPTIALPCPCGGPSLQTCCGPFLSGTALPPTAEALMRSRYTAYAQKNEAYLVDTWHRSTRPGEPVIDEKEPIRWLGLEIKSALRLRQRKVNSTDDPDSDTVEFVARFKVGGRAHRLHEVSRFLREPDPDTGAPRWYYVDGSFPT
ncbi:YchJ family protein [Massilia sp. H6]|uniref:YchJ family protein n=1 Tax=Massilia sp. H6 TaxID=2970464 RepID=UPI0021695A2E|nr:YchJ family metal-binding protein [Massilia sp. H6]UVW28704.1 YchJ family metal-binding protein [Massilia sp. H6]